MYNIPGLVGNADFVEALAASLETGGPPPLLRDAKIKLTSLCNLRCVMCKYWQTEREDTLDSDRWRDVFAELVTLGCRKVHFSGGEVFLRRDFLDLVESAVGLGLKVNVTTNGTLVDRERAKRLAASGVNSVSISLDGPTAASHDAVRGQAHAFRRSLRTIRRLRAHSERVRVRVNFVVMRRTFRRLPAMVRLAGELGAEELLLSAAGLYARGYFTRRSCLAPWLHAFFAWNGDAYLCCMTNGRMDPLGNVGRQTVREVFHGPAYRKVRRRFLAGHHLASCHRCDLFLAENSRLHAVLDGVGDGAGAVLEAPGPQPALAQ